MAESPFLFGSLHSINLKYSSSFIHSDPKFRFIGCYCTEGKGNQGRLESSEYTQRSGILIKAPTAPWMSKPLLVKSIELLDLKNPRTRKKFVDRTNGESGDVDLTKKVGGGRNKLAMKKIFRGIQELQQFSDSEETGDNSENFEYKFAPGDLFVDEDNLNDVEAGKRNVGSEDTEFQIPITEVVNEVRLKKMPWKIEETVDVGRINNTRSFKPWNIDQILLERLRIEASKMRKWIKVMKAGVTQAVVAEVRFAWKSNELALLKFDVPLCKNMNRAREIVELKTGGLTVWRHKDFLAVYRGDNYELREYRFSSMPNVFAGYKETSTSDNSDIDEISSQRSMLSLEDDEREILCTKSLYEREADRLLDGLGPRFIDWWMHKPLPVDADLLPEFVPGLKAPSRQCPPFTRIKLTGAELTYLRKSARSLPTHFVLGRNRRLQGLAAAIQKLWEKCHIAKIAVKWGIQNTDNEQMANELKTLTGGVLLLRNKFLIILYRGKDFLSSEVANAVIQRENELSRSQIHEEAARLRANETFSFTEDSSVGSLVTGTLLEFHDLQHGHGTKGKAQADVQLESDREKLEKELKEQQKKLSILKKKIEKAARDLEKLKDASRSSEPDQDAEIISNEESRSLKNMGMISNSSLVLGRRGVYNGVIEGMHQHWKHREVVKVITKQKNHSQIMFTAKALEAESGGIVVSLVEVKEGHAIIIYRGKNYKRPKSPAMNLLTKKEALSKSLLLQRFGSLRFFAKQRELAINDLKRKLFMIEKAIEG